MELCRDSGKENGNYYLGSRVSREYGNILCKDFGVLALSFWTLGGFEVVRIECIG